MIQFRSSEWEGMDDLSEELIEELRPRAEQLVMQGALLLETRVKETLSGGRSGRVYRVPGTSAATYVASAPGEAPAVLRGNLRNSVGHTRPRWEGDAVSSEVGPGLGKPPKGGPDPGTSYARRMEWGGDHVDKRSGAIIRILPRPYMRPAAERATPEIHALFEAGI